jgi:NaMN:DMB phosphoribosyltransferase
MPQNTTPAANLAGFSQMAAILALCAKETHVGGARALR